MDRTVENGSDYRVLMHMIWKIKETEEGRNREKLGKGQFYVSRLYIEHFMILTGFLDTSDNNYSERGEILGVCILWPDSHSCI